MFWKNLREVAAEVVVQVAVTKEKEEDLVEVEETTPVEGQDEMIVAAIREEESAEVSQEEKEDLNLQENVQVLVQTKAVEDLREEDPIHLHPVKVG